MHSPVNTAIALVLLVTVVGGSFFYVYTTHSKQPYLGIRGDEVTPAIARALGMAEPKGLLIFVVDPGSPADRAGLRGGDRITVIDGKQVALGGDVIIAIDGVQVQGINDAQALLANKVSGDSVKFTIIRGNATLDVNGVIGEK